MKLRKFSCVVGSMLAAWYLLQPPLNSTNDVVGDAPMTIWTIRQSLQTEADCKAARDALRANPAVSFQGLPATTQKQLADFLICLPADAPSYSSTVDGVRFMYFSGPKNFKDYAVPNPSAVPTMSPPTSGPSAAQP
jgi:hypothetical protein